MHRVDQSDLRFHRRQLRMGGATPFGSEGRERASPRPSHLGQGVLCSQRSRPDPGTVQVHRDASQGRRGICQGMCYSRRKDTNPNIPKKFRCSTPRHENSRFFKTNINTIPKASTTLLVSGDWKGGQVAQEFFW